VILTSSSPSVFAQKTKQITKKDRYSTFYKTYYVLKSDKSIKHGSYQELRSNNDSVVVNGYYNNGLKDSIWTEFNAMSFDLLSKGHYKKVNVLGFGNSITLKANYIKNMIILKTKYYT
jgi:hypothetical protein